MYKRFGKWDVLLLLVLIVSVVDYLFTGSAGVYKMAFYQSSRPFAYWFVIFSHLSLIVGYVFWVLFRSQLDE